MTSRWTNRLLNTALLLGVVVVVVLVYALVTRSIGSDSSPTREENPADLVGDIIQVEVRNGAGVDHLASETTHYLRDRGFDVVEVGDHDSYDQEQSVVIDRVGDEETAQRVAAALGLPDDQVQQDIRPDLYLDASVVIGHDYESLAPFD